jgi:hypothetical protein
MLLNININLNNILNMKVYYLCLLACLFKICSFSETNCNTLISLVYDDASELIKYYDAQDIENFNLSNKKGMSDSSDVKKNCLINENNKLCLDLIEDFNKQACLFDFYIKMKKINNAKEQMSLIKDKSETIRNECKEYNIQSLRFPDLKKCLEDVKKYQKDIAELQKAVTDDNKEEIDRLLAVLQEDEDKIKADCT